MALKVLFTTVYLKNANVITDMVAEHVKTYPRAGANIKISPGLRFLKQNIKEIEILEYPSWNSFIKQLKNNWNIIGISVYLCHIPEVLEMIKYIKENTKSKIWLGNYGASADELKKYADKIIIGSGFNEVASLFNKKIVSIEHPVLMANVSAIFNIRFIPFGILYTYFGCSHKCTYCQTPYFIKNCFPVDLDSIDKVVRLYKKKGIKYIAIFDETFGISPKHHDAVTKILRKYNMYWAAQSRVEIFNKSFNLWYKRGLRLPGIGLEFMNQKVLNEVQKNQILTDIYKYASITSKPGVFRYAFTIIGHPKMTIDDMINDALEIRKIGFELNRTSVLTPFPGTDYWNYVQNKYGIIEKDFHKYDSRNLIWKHPEISREEMLKLLRRIQTTYNSSWKLYRDALGRLVFDEFKKNKLVFIWQILMKGPISAYLINEKKQIII